MWATTLYNELVGTTKGSIKVLNKCVGHVKTASEQYSEHRPQAWPHKVNVRNDLYHYYCSCQNWESKFEQRRAGRISRYTRSHSKNATLGKCLFLGIDTKFGFKSIELAEMELYF
jgi:hypothetical protein